MSGCGGAVGVNDSGNAVGMSGYRFTAPDRRGDREGWSEVGHAMHGTPIGGWRESNGRGEADKAAQDGLDSLVEAVHRRVLDTLDCGSLRTLDVAGAVRAVEPLAAPHTVETVVERVVALVDGLGAIEPLLSDPAVSEVMVNGPGPVWIERDGTPARSGVSLDRAAVDLLIERIVAPLGRRVDQRTPCVDGRLPDGSRVHVVVPPIAVDGPYVTIRRFVVNDIALGDVRRTASGVAAGRTCRQRRQSGGERGHRSG